MRLKAAATLCAILVLLASALAGTEKVLYTFTGGSDGGNPVDVGSLVRDSAGNLYGTTEYEGSCGEGTVFQLSNDGIETVLHSFCGADGSSPIASVIRDSSGDFYGTTIGGGSIGCGTTFKLSGSTLTTLHSFTCGGDGGSPLGVVLDKSGNLYGVANLGGTNNNGLVYEISSSGQFSVIYTFCSVAGCADGASPARGLVMDTAGSIYGTTVNGGAPSCVFGCGTVFKLSEGGNSWTETVLHTFTGRDGQYPVEITVSYQVNAGRRQLRLFGTTGEGGSGGDGTVFEMSQSKSGFKLTTIHNFTGNNGEYPYGELSLVKGKLFGTTNFAGSGGFGTVFRLTQTNRGWTADTLYSFTDGADGEEPEGGVIADPAGNLYGTAPFGGNTACYPTGCGVVFEITP